MEECSGGRTLRLTVGEEREERERERVAFARVYAPTARLDDA